jgi:rhodanese-related sulfurtransferase
MNQMHLIGLALVISLAQAGMALAGEVDAASVPAAKQTISKNYLTSKEAAAMKASMGAKALLVDVRTAAEVEYVGSPDMVDANISYMTDDYSAWDDKKSRFVMSPNSGFLTKIGDAVAKAGLDKHSDIIVMCRSGDRSARAADLLSNAGYTKVYSVIDGFEGDMAKDGDNNGKRVVNGWKNAGLPWSYNMNKNKMYIE